MQKMSNLDFFFVERELSEKAKGAFLNKAFEPEPGVFRFKLRAQGEELNLLVELGVRAHLTRFLHESPSEPSSFITTLRQHLDNARLAGVRQINGDRILELEFEKAEKFFLIAEMFAKGNLLFCDSEKRIMRAFRKEEFASRELKGKRAYVAPPNAKKDARLLDAADLLSLAGALVPALSKAVNIAPFYLEEACARAGLAFDLDVQQLSEKQAKELAHCLAMLYSDFSPRVYCENGKPVAFAPFELKKLAAVEFKSFSSFSEALDEYYLNAEKNVAVEKPRNLAKLEAQLKQQESSLAEFRAKAVEFREAGDWVSSRIEAVDALLSAAKEKKLEARAKALKVKAKLNGVKLEIEA